MPRKQPLQGLFLDAVLTDTFRQAHAFKADGLPAAWPFCPSCYDAQHVITTKHKLRVNKDIRRYYCNCCRRGFSDCYGTPFEQSYQTIRVWAVLAFLPRPPRMRVATTGVSYGDLQRLFGVNKENASMLHRKMQGSPFVARWKGELEKAGVTVEKLLA